MIRFFKKFDPRIPISTGAGFRVPFETVTDESGQAFEWGVLQTSDGYIISELEALIRRNAGGVLEISKAEYESLKKKEGQTLLPTWRETHQPRQYIRRLVEDAKKLAAAVKPNGGLPAVVRGLQSEVQTLSRPMGAVNGWKPAVVAR